jgi:hypothetical protein
MAGKGWLVWALRALSRSLKYRTTEMKSDDVIHFAKEVQELLDVIEASNINNAITKIKSERSKSEKTSEQLRQLVNAADSDNWLNALRRISSLTDKEIKILPKWIQFVPPVWHESDRIPPSSFRGWLRQCQDQYLLVVSELSEEEYSEIHKQMETAYSSQLPWHFIEDCSSFFFEEDEDCSESAELAHRVRVE